MYKQIPPYFQQGKLDVIKKPPHTAKALRFQIFFIEQGRIKKFVDSNSKSLTHFVNNPQLDGIVGAVDDISNGGFGYAAFDI